MYTENSFLPSGDYVPGREETMYKAPKSNKRIEIEVCLTTISNEKGCIPNGTLKEIGDKYGLTRERIRQIAKALGLLMPHDQKTKVILHSKTCPKCRITFSTRNKYCSSECSGNRAKVTAPCGECGTMITRKKSWMEHRRYHFCNRTCLGKYAGRHWGWGSFLQID